MDVANKSRRKLKSLWHLQCLKSRNSPGFKMPTKMLIDILKGIVGKGNVLTDPSDLAVYSMDASPFRGQPGAVVFPQDIREAAEVLKEAGENRVAVVPRGAGTGLYGGAVPVKDGSIMMVSARMNHILELDLSSMTVFAESGVIIGTLNEFLSDHNLFFPIEPETDSVSTLGGCVARDAMGLRSHRYGSTRQWISFLEVATSTGEVLKVGDLTWKRPSGYSLIDLFVGSEGTLGFFGKIGVRVKRQARARKVLIATFPDHVSAAKAAHDIPLTGLSPSALEYMDSLTVKAVGEHLPDYCLTCHLLLTEFEGFTQAEGSSQSKRAALIVENHGGKAMISEEGPKTWNARKACLPALKTLSPVVIPFEMTLPLGKMIEALEAIFEIREQMDIQLAVFGHIGYGVLFPTVLFDSPDGGEVEKVIRRLLDMVIDLGGSLSGNLKRTRFIGKQRERHIELTKRLKKLFDPKDIMNPGKI